MEITKHGLQVFPRYGEIIKIAESRTGRCSGWCILFGAILNSLYIETTIVHDYLDHCWNDSNRWKMGIY
jgi:hypothetical protein